MSQLQWKVEPCAIERALEALLPDPVAEEESGLCGLERAMREAVLAGGKRTRPLLTLECTAAAWAVAWPERTFASSPACEAALHAACAVELIHAYSLVHDDLPAMDDADLRRGRPTCHRVWGEAMAILAGDALQSLAFECAARSGEARVVALLAHAAGPRGMAGGQAIDISWSRATGEAGIGVSASRLERLHEMKTGALIAVCARIGAVLGVAGRDEARLAWIELALGQYGAHLGRAFQIWDDVLDAEGDPGLTGKSASDAQNDKITAVATWGLDGAKERAALARDAALAALRNFGPEADTLRALARFVVARNQ